MTLAKGSIRWLMVVFALACLLRFGLIAVQYTPDLAHFSNGDYTLYAIGASDIQQRGSFDNSLFLVRPPLFPIMIAVLSLNASTVLLVNALLGALTAPLTYIFARQCRLSGSMSALAALIVAVDPASIVYSAFLGSEALANITLLLAVILLFASLQHPRSRLALLLAAVAGTALVFSALARPASFLLWIVLAGWGIFVYRRKWVPILVFALVSAIGVGGWVIHNGLVFGNATFSTIGVYNLLYYRAASVEARATGRSLDDTYTELSRRVEARLGHDTSKVDAGTRYGHETATAALQPVMQAVAVETFLRYPTVYVSTIPIGLYRILVFTDGFSSGITVLFIGWNVCLVLGTAAGLIVLYRTKQYAIFGFILLVCAYYIFGTLVVQTSGIDTRARTMITPLMAVATIYWLRTLFVRRFNFVVGST